MQLSGGRRRAAAPVTERHIPKSDGEESTTLSKPFRRRKGKGEFEINSSHCGLCVASRHSFLLRTGSHSMAGTNREKFTDSLAVGNTDYHVDAGIDGSEHTSLELSMIMRFRFLHDDFPCRLWTRHHQLLFSEDYLYLCSEMRSSHFVADRR